LFCAIPLCRAGGDDGCGNPVGIGLIRKMAQCAGIFSYRWGWYKQRQGIYLRSDEITLIKPANHHRKNDATFRFIL